MECFRFTQLLYKLVEFEWFTETYKRLCFMEKGSHTVLSSRTVNSFIISLFCIHWPSFPFQDLTGGADSSVWLCMDCRAELYQGQVPAILFLPEMQ